MILDLNADLGEGIGNDDALLDCVTSANVACGLHAGNVAVMARTMKAAAMRGVSVGVHPGFDDKKNFGRTRQHLSSDDLRTLTAYQVGAAHAVATALGIKLRHLKLHGALANMAAADENLALTCYQAALDVHPDLVLLVMAGTRQEQAAYRLQVPLAAEIFADRAYRDDGHLVDRSLPGAVLHDPDEIAQRVLKMLHSGAIIAQSGLRIPGRIESLCLHGDTEQAVDIALKLKEILIRSGVKLQAF